MDALKFTTFTNNVHKSREEADAAVSQPDGPKAAQSELPQVPDAIQQTIDGLKSSGFVDFTYDEKTGLSFKSKDGVPINFGPITSRAL